MKTKTVVVIVGIVVAVMFAIPFSTIIIPWDFYLECIQNGMIPSGTRENHSCNEFGLNTHEPLVSQNDLACFTVWKVQLNTPIDYETLEAILRDKIAEFGSVYNIPERNITIENIGNNRVKITIEGMWGPDPEGLDIRESISNIEFVEKIEDFVGGPVEGGCY